MFNAWVTRSSNISEEGISDASSDLPNTRLPLRKYSSRASNNKSLFLIESSILIFSIPSVYSPILGKGITTSSLILNAFVWREIAAVLDRSSQNFFLASGLIAIKPSPTRLFAMRITSLAAAATTSASSPTMSPIKTIFGNTFRFDFVV